VSFPAEEICVPLPSAKKLTIPMPWGMEIRAVLDASRPPNDCAIVHSLMLQLNPMIGGLACLMKILAVIQALKGAIDSGGTDFGKVAEKIGDMASCFLLIDPCEVQRLVSSILCVVITYLNCVIQAFDSILNFQVGIDLDSAEGNPVLLANLTCAQENAQRAMDGVTNAMEAATPLMEMVNILLEIAGADPVEMPVLQTPSAEQLLGGEDPLAPIKAARDALVAVNESLPPGCRVECPAV
jgi:hypothetical protein